MTTTSKPGDTMDGGLGRLLRIEDIADRLAVSRSMAWKLISLGHLPAIRIGRSVRVRSSDLERYIDGAAADR